MKELTIKWDQLFGASNRFMQVHEATPNDLPEKRMQDIAHSTIGRTLEHLPIETTYPNQNSQYRNGLLTAAGNIERLYHDKMYYFGEIFHSPQSEIMHPRTIPEDTLIDPLFEKGYLDAIVLTMINYRIREAETLSGTDIITVATLIERIALGSD